MEKVQLQHYYNRYDSKKNYDSVLLRAAHPTQSAEMNEMQSMLHTRIRGVGDALFKDGDIIRDARAVVDPSTGKTICESGALYIAGAVRGVPPAEFTIPLSGIVVIGVRIQQKVISELEDEDLYNPALGTRSHGEAGACRLQTLPYWGWDGDGKEGEFYPVHTVEDGMMRVKEAPPEMDSVTQALARYDRDSSGGSYVVSGFTVQTAADATDGAQIYTISEGRARVTGYGVELPTSRRIRFDAAPDEREIRGEPHNSTTIGTQVIQLDRSPVARVTSVQITAEKQTNMTHGAFNGAQDAIEDTAVSDILEIKQDATTYTKGVDYKLTAGKVDWSLSGAEPAPGSTYTIRYRYVTNVTPSNVTASSCTVSGAVVGSQIYVTYFQYLPRIDRLCVSADGELIWIKGVSADWNPISPPVPGNLLPIASVVQTWDGSRQVINDGVRVVPMNELAGINNRIDHLNDLIAQQRLESDANLREAGTKKGLFVDPFLGDDMRDAGINQTAAIFAGELTLPMSAAVTAPDSDVTQPISLEYSLVTVVEQLLQTGEMLVNPYAAFGPLPVEVSISPAMDRWTEFQTHWAGAITQQLTVGSGSVSRAISNSSTTQSLGTTTKTAANLRPISINFKATGMAPNEVLRELRFDGIAVAVTS